MLTYLVCTISHWQDHAADGHSDFKQYDRLSFVVVLLNFLREDAAALLRPGDRWQTADHSCQAGTRQDGATGGRRLLIYFLIAMFPTSCFAKVFEDCATAESGAGDT